MSETPNNDTPKTNEETFARFLRDQLNHNLTFADVVDGAGEKGNDHE